ncbi:MAG: DUF2817 domain-containing protein [Marivibrio sp.]|uniref:DUF2817 domain-containing protein n=1 Tax=Marivibrio sp. TaxID=2039719 RepID=UPI0032EDCAE6
MADADRLFSDDLATARARFLTACDKIGLRVASYPGRGPAPADDGPLYCDVARLGSPEATRMLVLCPAGAGGAGFAGAAAVLGVLSGGLIRDLPRDVSCLLIHAVNPLGPIWPDRPDAPPPASSAGNAPGPGDGAPLTADWDDGVLSAAERRFAAYEEAQRFDRERLAGRTLAELAPPAWDAAVLQAIADAHFPGKRKLLFIDVRTGPGPFGDIEFIAPKQAGAGAPETAQRWLGLPLAGGSEGLAEARAPTAGGLPALARAPALETSCVVLEAGVYSMATLLQASGPAKSGAGAAYPRDRLWREQVWDAAADLIRRGFNGLAAA